MSNPGKQFVAFLGVGGVAALANFGSRFAFALLTTFEVSILLAFVVGLTSAFLLNRRFVFSEDRETSWRTEAVRFLIVNLVGLAVTMIAAIVSLYGLLWVFGPNPFAEGIAHFVGLGCTAVTSYVAHKFWTFRG